jgi:hypothetical protein
MTVLLAATLPRRLCIIALRDGSSADPGMDDHDPHDKRGRKPGPFFPSR